MPDPLTAIRDIRRPRLLIRAAQSGLADYRRDRDLRRIMRADAVPAPENAVHLLLDEERRLEETRQAGDAGYSFSRHIEVLIAMLSEARLLPQRLA